ncbi:uncharacterized protein LOC110416234 [Herrania umbratica]|uniref:Uncharacterized protein LOC110416234 n=1 Tax=Herrania umbratica TaxID=108875 RepID=A0A6J1AAH6_9ROSI|nr:uncharacterized protein LOC110416234 [Herrania umbratica]
MTSWYGPLIDLSKASHHVGHFVQLLVFVHRSTPLQYKLSRGGEIIRTDIQVGDDTRPFFSVTLWKKEMRSMVVAGDVVLLQNVKITKFRDVFQARTVDWSSLHRLVHPYNSLVSKGAVELVAECRVGIAAKEKLRKVIEWVQRTGYTALNNAEAYDCQSRQLSRNWKLPEPNKFRDCPSLSEVLRLTSHCKAIFSASVGEIFLPITWRPIAESESENMFISGRLNTSRDNNLAEDLICTGCRLCGSPLDPEQGSTVGKNSLPLYCEKSSDRLHAVSLIYRPCVLYVWDESEYMPLLVKNNAAEKLFGNIKAERVYLCYREYKCDKNPDPGCTERRVPRGTGTSNSPKAAGTSDTDYCSSDAHKKQESGQNKRCHKNINIFLIWLVILKMLLQQGKNSPLKFEVAVNASLDTENGRFEMISVSTPCFKNIWSLQ